MFSLRVPYVLRCMYTDVNCVVFDSFELGPNYVPAALKLPTSSPPHGISLDPPGGLRPVFFILYLSKHLDYLQESSFFFVLHAQEKGSISLS